MDERTKQQILELVCNDKAAEGVVFELGMLDECTVNQRIQNQERLEWLIRNGIKGRELAQLYESLGRNPVAFCEHIDSKRREKEEDRQKQIQTLAVSLSNDETPIKRGLLSIADILEKEESLLDFFSLVSATGMTDQMKDMLRYNNLQSFIETVIERHREHSVMKQNYENARLCSEAIVNNRRVKACTLQQLIELIHDKMGCDHVRQRALVLLQLMRCGWTGMLSCYVEKMYNRRYECPLLPLDKTPFSLCCYVLLCSASNVDAILTSMRVLNEKWQ